MDQGFEVLACRCTDDSLHAAATVISWLAANGRPRPVLAVTCDGPVPARGPLRAGPRMIEPQVAGLVVLPFVAHWRELTEPRREATARAEAVLRAGLLQPGWPVVRTPRRRPFRTPVGRRRRGGLARDGLIGSVWVLGGLALASDHGESGLPAHRVGEFSTPAGSGGVLGRASQCAETPDSRGWG